MAKLLKLRRGTTTQHASFTGAEGEVTVDTTKDTAVVHDGAQAGGRPLAREDMSNVSSANIAGQLGTDSIATTKIAAGALPTDVTVADANISGNLTIESADIVDGTIVNADVNASAAIAGTKVAPDFGSQNTTTTGTTTTSKVTVNSSTPIIEFSESDGNPDYRLLSEGGEFVIQDIQAGPATRLKVNTDGHVDVAGNLDVGAGLDVTGNITSTGTIGSSGDITITNDIPRINFVDSGDNPDWEIGNINGAFRFRDDTNGATYMQINTDGHVDVLGNLDVGAGLDVTGAITSTGNISVTNINPNIALIDSNNSSDFQVQNDNGNFNVRDTTNSANRLRIDATGGVNIPGNTDFGAGIDVTGNITATGTVDGRDVAADGTKLDGIESGATADQTNAQISAALSDQRPSMKGAIFTDDGITDTPVVKIKTDDSSPWALQIANDSYWNNNQNGLKLYQDNSGNIDSRVTGNGAFVNWYFNTQNGSTTNTAIHIDTNRAVNLNYQGNTRLSTTNAGVSVTGDMTASGNVTAYSDSRLKTDISTINDALGIVGKLRGVSYKWLRDGSDGIGVIAQEIEKVIPSVVVTNKVEGLDGIEEVKSVDYGKIVGVLINAINELKAEVDELKGGK
nr:hypothetical protein [uncultured Mediterranean phage uvMED]